MISSSFSILGIPITTLNLEGVVKEISDSLEVGKGLSIHLCNTFTLSLIDSNPQLRKSLEQADINLPDGWPIALVGKTHGIRCAIRGSDLFEGVMNNSDLGPYKHFFLGGKSTNNKTMLKNIKSRFQDVEISGSLAPGFHQFEKDDYDLFSERILKSKADIVWIGLGTPKQDIAILELSARCPSKVFIPIGIVFDFWAGSVKEAPEYMRTLKLEWLHRLIQEPRKMWRRYFVNSPIFAIKILNDKLRRSVIRHEQIRK
jgi:N-acetylglucosaminyldiphosphoundecaprenol N-acetyl-beta-D-mannosaminyltransferase